MGGIRSFGVRQSRASFGCLCVLGGLVGWSAAIEAAEPEGLITPPAAVAVERRGEPPRNQDLPQGAPISEEVKVEDAEAYRVVPLQLLAMEKVHYALPRATFIRRKPLPKDDAVRGRMAIEVVRDTPLYLGIRRFKEYGTEEIRKELWTPERLADEGWLPVGVQKIWDPDQRKAETHVVYFRDCRAGEKFDVRTSREVPPILFTTPDPAPAFLDMEPSSDLPEEMQRNYVGTMVRILLAAEKFDELRRRLDYFLTTAAEFSSGHYLSRSVTRGFSPSRRRTAAFFKEQTALIDRLLEKYPESNGVRLAAADFFISHAVALEKDRDADSSESEDLYRRALDYLYAVEQSDPKLPHMYHAYISLALRQEWDEELTKEYFNRALASKSWCPQAVGDYIGYLHRYHFTGESSFSARVQGVVEQAVDATRDRYGDQMYAACIKDLDHYFPEDPFVKMGFQWPRLKASFEAILAARPDSRRILREYCKMASAAGDRETARRMFDQLGPRTEDDEEGWESDIEYEISRKWAADDYTVGDQQAIYDLGPRGAVGLHWSPRGPVVLDRKGWLHLLDLDTGARQRIAGTTLKINVCLAGDRYGQMYLMGTFWGSVVLLSSGNGFQYTTYELDDDRHVYSVAVSNDATLGLAGVRGGKAYVFELGSEGPQISESRSVEASKTEAVYYVGFLPDAKTFVTYARGDVKIWNTETLELVKSWSAGKGGDFATMSRDGKYLAADAGDKILKVWDLATGELHSEIPGAAENSGSLAFSSDGRTLAVAQGYFEQLNPSVIRMIDMATKTVTKTLKGHKGSIRGLAFSPDDKILLSVSMDRSARLWVLDPSATAPAMVAAAPIQTASVAPGAPAVGAPAASNPAGAVPAGNVIRGVVNQGPPAPTPGLPKNQREAAVRLLGYRSTLEVYDAAGVKKQVREAADLPPGELEIARMEVQDGKELTDADVETLSTFRRLQSVVIRRSQLTGATLDRLQALPILRELTLTHCPLTDVAFEHVAKIPHLMLVDLSSTQVTDAGLVKLKEMPELKYVLFSASRLTDAGMERLAELPQLERIVLDQTPIGDAGIAALSKLTKVKVLGLREATITDRAVADLAKMQSLTTLYLNRTKLSEEAYQELEKALKPNTVKR